MGCDAWGLFCSLARAGWALMTLGGGVLGLGVSYEGSACRHGVCPLPPGPGPHLQHHSSRMQTPGLTFEFILGVGSKADPPQGSLHFVGGREALGSQRVSRGFSCLEGNQGCCGARVRNIMGFRSRSWLRGTCADRGLTAPAEAT